MKVKIYKITTSPNETTIIKSNLNEVDLLSIVEEVFLLTVIECEEVDVSILDDQFLDYTFIQNN